MKEVKKVKKSNFMELKDFEDILKIFKNMIEKDAMRISFTPEGMDLEIRPPSAKTFAKYNLQKETTESFMEEIFPLIRIILRDEVAEYIIKSSKGVQEIKKSLEEKIELIQRELIDEKMKQQYLLRTTCKTNLFEDIHWDISIKQTDKVFEKIPSIPIVTLKFLLYDPHKTRGCPEISSQVQSFVFECTEREIDILIDELNGIKESLKRIKVERG